MNDRGVEVIQVIHTNLERRGLGRSMDDIVRRVEQYWSMDGELLWEYDPFPGGRAPVDEPPKPNQAMRDAFRDANLHVRAAVPDA